MREIYFAAGCFWGAEKFFKRAKGVTYTKVGFANGNTVNPTYKEVYTDSTGFAECVHVKYDEGVVSLERLVRLFYRIVDPTSLNKQGEDEGTRYRCGIYYTDPEDANVINSVTEEIAAKFDSPLVVEILPLKNFYLAEEYHQNYLDKNPEGYCHLPLALFEEEY